jgi:hypothetical protein
MQTVGWKMLGLVSILGHEADTHNGDTVRRTVGSIWDIGEDRFDWYKSDQAHIMWHGGFGGTTGHFRIVDKRLSYLMCDLNGDLKNN